MLIFFFTRSDYGSCVISAEIHLKTGQAVGLWPDLLDPTKREEPASNMDVRE